MEAEQTTLRVHLRWSAGRRLRRALALFGLACLAWTAVVEVELDALVQLYGVLSAGGAPRAERSSAREARPRSDGGEAAIQAMQAARRRLIGVLRAQQASAQARVAELRKRLVDEVHARRALPPAPSGSVAAVPGPAATPPAPQGAPGVVSAGGVSSRIPETWTDEALWEWGRTGGRRCGAR